MKKFIRQVDDIHVTVKISDRTSYGNKIGERLEISFEDPKLPAGIVREPQRYEAKSFNIKEVLQQALRDAEDFSEFQICRKWFYGIYSFEQVSDILLGSKKAKEILTGERARGIFLRMKDSNEERWENYKTNMLAK